MSKAAALGWAAVLLGLAGLSAAEPDRRSAAVLQCDREMRRTFEAVQAWRRANEGAYPPRLLALETRGMVPPGSCVCPAEAAGAGGLGHHHFVSSRSSTGDPIGAYEYEPTTTLRLSDLDRHLLPKGARSYTRQDIKLELLRRPFSEQIPILRCMVHAATTGPNSEFEPHWARNLTHDGHIHWSGHYWERLWLDDVPAPARSAMVLFGLEGPPFHSGKAPTLPNALDLRPWATGFPQVSWSSLTPLIEVNGRTIPAPDLAPFTGPVHPVIQAAGGESWWIDGLVQLQGRRNDGLRSPNQEPHAFDFAWSKTRLPVARTFSRASWLQGTLFADLPGTVVGWLDWHYQDGTSARVEIHYETDTGVFWNEGGFANDTGGTTNPAWELPSDARSGLNRRLRLFRQEWINPHPSKTVVSLDFHSSKKSKAAPFILAVNLHP